MNNYIPNNTRLNILLQLFNCTKKLVIFISKKIFILFMLLTFNICYGQTFAPTEIKEKEIIINSVEMIVIDNNNKIVFDGYKDAKITIQFLNTNFFTTGSFASFDLAGYYKAEKCFIKKYTYDDNGYNYTVTHNYYLESGNDLILLSIETTSITFEIKSVTTTINKNYKSKSLKKNISISLKGITIK